MKYSLLLLTLLFVGCAQSGGTSAAAGACANSAVVGAWDSDTSANVMTFSADCTGSDVSCQSTFTYPGVTASSGSVLVTVTSTNGGGGCLPIGDTSCTYALTSTQLAFDCGAGVSNYTKQ